MQRRTNSLFLLLALAAAHLTIDLTQGAIPALGSYMENFHGWSYARVGSLAMLTSVTSVILQPLGGYYGDRTRNGLLLPISLLLAGGGLLTAGFSPPASYGPIVAGVFIASAGVALFHPDGMRAASYVVGPRRAAGMSIFMVGGNTGFGLGPAVAALGMSWYGLPGLLLAALPALLWSLVVMRILPPLRSLWGPQEAPDPSAAGEIKPDQANTPVKDDWGAQARIMAVVGLRAIFQITMATYLPLYVTGVLSGTHTEGNFVASLYLLGGAAGTLIGGPIADRIGLRPYLTWALGFIGPLHLITLSAPVKLKPYLLMVQGGLLVSTLGISILLSQSYAPQNLALVSGLNAGANIGLGGLGAAVAGLAADYWGLLPTLTGLVAFPVLAALLSLTLPKTPAGEPVVVQYSRSDGGR